MLVDFGEVLVPVIADKRYGMKIGTATLILQKVKEM